MLPEWACRSEVLVGAGLLGDKGFGVVGALISSTCLLGLAEIFKAKSDQSVKKRISVFCNLSIAGHWTANGRSESSQAIDVTICRLAYH